MSYTSPSFLVTAIFLARRVQSQSSSTCYWPNESPAINASSGVSAQPCTAFSQDGESHCCYPNDLCTSSGFCVSTLNANFYRGACTKRDWDTNACPNVCFGTVSDVREIPVMACSETTFACGFGSVAGGHCDDSNSAKFNVAGAEPLGFQVLDTRPSLPQVQVIPVSSAVSTASAAAATATTSCSAVAHPTCPRSNTAAVGAGLGTVLGLALLTIAVLAAMLFRKRRRRTPEFIDASPTKNGTPTAELAAYNGASELRGYNRT